MPEHPGQAGPLLADSAGGAVLLAADGVGQLVGGQVGGDPAPPLLVPALGLLPPAQVHVPAVDPDPDRADSALAVQLEDQGCGEGGEVLAVQGISPALPVLLFDALAAAQVQVVEQWRDVVVVARKECPLQGLARVFYSAVECAQDFQEYVLIHGPGKIVDENKLGVPCIQVVKISFVFGCEILGQGSI